VSRVKPSKKIAAADSLPPRERILAAAQELFYARGIRGVSVDDIATAAQTNKMTFYRHFESKDLLVAEYLRVLARESESIWEELARAHPGDPMAQLRAWVGHIGTMMADCRNRGCALANAAVEIPEKGHPARAVIEAYKTGKHERIAALCRSAGFQDPERIADEVFLLFEGARVDQQSVGAGGPGMRVAELICALLRSSPRVETSA
jgi:AcrR family transcriptional regulator